jgi:hypothetical protein
VIGVQACAGIEAIAASTGVVIRAVTLNHALARAAAATNPCW